ncbi:MAG: DnaD domain protein [Bacilli bacterium]|nr:DnaD domain protein [Bacilli bacterium]
MKTTVHDFFKISSIPSLSAEDHLSLAQMYLPIIGIDSFTLYNFFNTLKENEKYTFKKLLDSLNLGSLTLLKNAFGKLEAVALIRSYVHEQKGYLFQIIAPLSRVAFLENTLLASVLSSQIGEVEFKRLVNEAKPPVVRGYEEITKAFDDVYTVNNLGINDMFTRLLKIKSTAQVQVKNPDFDYIFFKMNFDSNFIDPKILDDEQFKQRILNISFNYQLNEEEMKDIIIKTITVDKDLKFADVSKNARNFYQKKNKRKEPYLVTKEADAFVNSETDDDRFRLIEYLERMSPNELLYELNGGIKPAISELKMAEDLVNNTKFPSSVINLMLLLVNNEKDGVLPGYNYFEKIANTWARANLKTPQDVLNYLNKPEALEKKTTYSGNKRKAPLPEWYGKYEEQLDSLPKAEAELSATEIDKILEEAKKFN